MGHSQDYNDIDVSACEEDNIKIARRITVGNATYCNFDNFHFSILLKGEDMRPRYIATHFANFLADALQQLKLEIKVHDFIDTREGYYPDCFKTVAPDQGSWEGKKLVSIAQSKSRTSIVIHGVIPMKPTVYFGDKYLTLKNPDPVVGASLKGTGITKEHLRYAIINKFSETYGVDESYFVFLKHYDEIIKLRKEKYLSEDWLKYVSIR